MVGKRRGEKSKGEKRRGEQRSLPLLHTHARDRVERVGFSSSDHGFGVEDMGSRV